MFKETISQYSTMLVEKKEQHHPHVFKSAFS